MEKNDLFDFELNEAEGYWSVTGYYGSGGEVVFPASYKGKPVKAIGDDFSPNNKRIKQVTIPEGYTSIGNSAFQNCTGLTEIKLPESLTSIGEWAFYDCTGLTGITFPEGLTSIGKWSFSGCTGLTEIIFPKSLTSIEDNAFYECTGLKEIKLPEEGHTSIKSGAFQKCTGLTKIKLPKSLTSFNGQAFEDCTELAEINVDGNNPVFCSVDGVMFDKAMTTLMWFPQGKKGAYSVPEGIISIRSGAFGNCELITGISFPQSLLFIDSYGFNSDQLTVITVNENNQKFKSIDGVLFDKENNALLEYPKNRDKTDYTVPDGILYIADSAFYRCKRLVNIVLPESLEIIRNYAFDECEGLKAVILPRSLRFIGERAFEDCPNLETVTLSKKTRIGHKAFDGFKGKFVYLD